MEKKYFNEVKSSPYLAASIIYNSIVKLSVRTKSPYMYYRKSEKGEEPKLLIRLEEEPWPKDNFGGLIKIEHSSDLHNLIEGFYTKRPVFYKVHMDYEGDDREFRLYYQKPFDIDDPDFCYGSHIIAKDLLFFFDN